MNDLDRQMNQLRNIVRIATAADRTKRASKIMQFILDNGGLVRMQEIYDEFDMVCERTVRQNVADIDDSVVVKYRTTNNIVEVTIKDKKTTEFVLAARRAENLE